MRRNASTSRLRRRSCGLDELIHGLNHKSTKFRQMDRNQDPPGRLKRLHRLRNNRWVFARDNLLQLVR